MSEHHKSKPEHIRVEMIAHDKPKPAILKAEIVAESRLFKVESLHLQFSNGEERVYERMRGGNRGAVMVVPMLDAHTLLLVREYAAGTHSYELGFPKGLIDPGENALEAGNRELMEEAGFGARELVPLKQLSLAPGYFSSRMDILLARDLYPEQRIGDEPEPLEVIPWPLDRVDELLARPDFTESRSISALLLAQKWLAEQGNERP
ncbi:MAG: ADP compounds hydrolase NudE [Aeromonas sp.]|uniref:ADP compounds hydrolase NudE n=1 Tax=Aeromonas sp. TaxID=647 RepID=UPI003F2DF0D9